MNRMQQVVLGTAAAFSMALSVVAVAHHGWSGYETEIRKVSGVIDQSSYSNPHGSIRLKAADKTWVVVLAPPSRMGNRGLTEEMLKAGTTVSVDGYQHMSDKNEMRAERISIDGKTIELR
jgi:hypothetical protein